MEEKKIVITNAFTPRKRVKKEKIWDQEYVSLVPKDVVKKIGEGEEDFTIITKFVERREDINKLINSQANEVGIYNLLDRIAKTGDDTLLPKPFDDKSGQVLDYTRFPEDLMDVHQQQDQAAIAFDSLPDELKKGRKFEDFAANVTDAEAIEFIKAFIQSRVPQKKEEKKGE